MMKEEIEIRERIEIKEKMITTGRNFDGGILNDGIIHDLKIQKDVLEWVLKK